MVRLYILELCAHIFRKTAALCTHEVNIFCEGVAGFPFLDVYL